jgi:DNA polymerase-3 subunit alpha
METTEDVNIVGIVNGYKEIVTKKGDRMAYITLEDTKGIIEAIIFPDLFSKHLFVIKSDKPLFINGTVERTEEGNTRIIAKNIALLEDVTNGMRKMIKIKINCEIFKKEDLRKLKDILYSLKGNSKVALEFQLNGEKHYFNIQNLRVDHNKMDVLLKHFKDSIDYEVLDEILS